MHEMAIVQSMMEIIEQQAVLHNARRVVRISLEFGALTAVLPTAVQFAFDVLAKDSVAEGASLDITIIPLKVRCADCANETILDDYQVLCPVCSSPAIRFIQGRDEMRIASLEIEDSHEES